MIQESNRIFLQGELLFNNGQANAGRVYFLRALNQLREFIEPISLRQELAQTYYSLLGRIQELELQHLDGSRETISIHEDGSSVDKLAHLNVFTIRVDPDLKHLATKDLLESRFDVPVVLNERVLRFLTYYQTRGRSFMEKGLRRSGRYLKLFREVFRREGVPQDLVYLAHVESLFKPHALSRARAKGIWQFIRGTGRLYGLKQDWWIDERSDILKSTIAAARYLKHLHSQFGDWYLALAGYNSGPRRVERLLQRYGSIDYWDMVQRRLLPRETRNYVPSILASMIIFKNPTRYGFQVEKEPELRFELISIKEQVDLSTVAELINVSPNLLRDLNPELRRGITPFEAPRYQMKVPLGLGRMTAEKIAALPPEKRLKMRHHQVQRGETLSVISMRYGTPIQAIAQANQLQNIHRLRVGQHLTIPLLDSKGSYLSRNRPKPAVRRVDSSGPHVVNRGDTLYDIALTYGVKLKDLLQWNNLNQRKSIFPGQKILVTP